MISGLTGFNLVRGFLMADRQLVALPEASSDAVTDEKPSHPCL